MEFKTCAEFAFSNLEKKIKEFNLFKKKIYIYQYSSPAKLFITYLLEKQINIIAIVDIRNDKYICPCNNSRTFACYTICKKKRK